MKIFESIKGVIDNFLNGITMYRLVLYILILLITISIVFSSLKLLPFSPTSVIFSTLVLILISKITNEIFAKAFSASPNVESVYITALILALIISPAKSLSDYIFIFWVAVLAMGSKYILAVNKKHIFNPVAIAVALTAFGINRSASWWIGDLTMLPFVFAGGFLIIRKLRREDMVFSFIITALIVAAATSLAKGGNIIAVLNEILLHSSLFFFAFVMFTEPLTTPPTYRFQMIYAVIVGILFVPSVHLSNIYSTPELALVIGNVFSYLVSPKEKEILFVEKIVKTSQDTLDFIFPLKKRISYLPGQYMEWTLPHNNPDDRGNRRYFTLASSPTEANIRLGVKFFNPPSSFKKALLKLEKNTPVILSQRAGDFTLPSNPNEKLVFIAGGIGITPFRSMLKYLIDKNEHRDIIMFYSNKLFSEIVYQDILIEAASKLRIKTVFTLTDLNQIPQGWQEEKGRINEEMIKKMMPDYISRTYYLSGPHAMVESFDKVLKNLGVRDSKIKKDFFPGFV